MFCAMPSSALGKPNNMNSKQFYPSTITSTDISFYPIKNPNGNVNYIPVVEKETEQVNIPANMVIKEETKSESERLYNNRNIYDTNVDDDTDDRKNIFSLENDYIKTFYIGSITVVGLYILFRILDKTK